MVYHLAKNAVFFRIGAARVAQGNSIRFKIDRGSDKPGNALNFSFTNWTARRFESPANRRTHAIVRTEQKTCLAPTYGFASTSTENRTEANQKFEENPSF